jgi:hypothetical protein
MKTIFKLNLSLFLFFSILVSSQENEKIVIQEPNKKSNWYISLGFNAVDDSGNNAEDLFNVSEAWNFVPYPSRISLGKVYDNGFGFELIGSYALYKKNKEVDFVELPADIDYYALDTRVTYDLNEFFKTQGWFDPYLGMGLGYAKANEIGRTTFNGVIGFRAWLSEDWALDFNSSGKWAISDNVLATNHLQHAIAILYKFKRKKLEN